MHWNLWCFSANMVLVKVEVHWSLVTYACRKVGSIPAFHSVQQNINSLIKYFPIMSLCICLHLCMIKWRCALSQKTELTDGTSAYAYHFSAAVVKRGWGHEILRKWIIREGIWGPEARALWCQKRKLYLWPPLWIHKWKFDPHLGYNIFHYPPHTHTHTY